MNRLVKSILAAACVLFLLAAHSPSFAQRSKKHKKELKRKGPDGMSRGQVTQDNVDRRMLLERQRAADEAKAAGFYAGPRYSLAKNHYESSGKRGFAVGKYENKTKFSKPKKQKKSKRIIDQDNPNGKLYQSSLRKRSRKFLFF